MPLSDEELRKLNEIVALMRAQEIDTRFNGIVQSEDAAKAALRIRNAAVAEDRERIIARLTQIDAGLSAPGIPLDAIVDVVRDEYPEDGR